MDGQCIGKGTRMTHVRVLHLDDSIHAFQISGHALGEELFATVVDRFRLLEANYFDLEYTNDEGMRCWLDHNKTVSRQYSANGEFVYRFAVKFYTPHPNLLEEAYTRYLFALQIKRDLVTGTLLCSENTAALLASYIVQAEIGDFIHEEYRTIAYLKPLKLLHEPTDERLRRVREFHKAHVGLSPTEADFALLDTARKIEFYGVRLHFARDHEGLGLNLAVTHVGLLVFQNLIKVNTFSWAKIRKLSFKRKRFLVKLHADVYDTIEFIFDSRDECKQFWKKSIEHHTFFRCTYPDRQSQKRSRLTSSGSSFRYTGRTQQELQEYVQRNYEKRLPFERPSAARQLNTIKTTGPTYSKRRLNSASLTLRSSSADRRSFMSGNMSGSLIGTLGKQPALKRAQSMGVNAISNNQQIADGSPTNIHLPITTLPTSGYATMSGSATGSGRSSHPRNIEDLEEGEADKLQSGSQNESGRRMTGDWSGDNENKLLEEDISSRAWKSEAGSPGQSLSRLNLELDAFLTSRDDQTSLSDQQIQNDSDGMNKDAEKSQSSKTSTNLVDLLQDGSIRGYLFSSSPSFDQGNEKLPDLSGFKASEHHLSDYNTSRSFNLINTSIFDSDSQPSWSLSFASKNLASQPDSLHRSEYSQPPPKPRRTSQILTTREENSMKLSSEPIQFERNTLMEPSLGEIIQLHMDTANILNPLTSMSSQRPDSSSNNADAVDGNAQSSNATTASLVESRPYEATLILPTVTQLGLEISLDGDLSFTRTTSVSSSVITSLTSSASPFSSITPTSATQSSVDSSTATTMTLSVLPNLSIRPQTVASSITIPPFTTSLSILSSPSTSTTYTTNVTSTKPSQNQLFTDQLLSPNHSILYDFLPHEDTFSITLNDIALLKSTESSDTMIRDMQLPKSETESNRVQLSDFLQTFGFTSSSNEPMDLVKSITKPSDNETYGCLFLDEFDSKAPTFSTASTTQISLCTTSTLSPVTTSPTTAKSLGTTNSVTGTKTYDSLFSSFDVGVSRFNSSVEPIHVASLDQWSSSSSESTTGVIIRSDLTPHTSTTCHHSVPCINSNNPMLQHSLTCPHASKSIPLEQTNTYILPSEKDISTNQRTGYKQAFNTKHLTSRNNAPSKSKHPKHFQRYEHVCAHGHHLSNSIPAGIHLSELDDSRASTSYMQGMIPMDNVKRTHGKHSEGKKSDQMKRNKHQHHTHGQLDQSADGNQNLMSLNDLETAAAEMLEEVPYVVLRRPRSVDVKQYQLHLEHQRQQAAALAAATGGYPFHLYQTPGAHFPFTSRLPIGSQLPYPPYVQPPPFHGFTGHEFGQSQHLDIPITSESHRKSGQSSKQMSHKYPSSHYKQISKEESDSCKRHSKRTHSKSRKETELFASDENDRLAKGDMKQNYPTISDPIAQIRTLPSSAANGHSHHRHHEHCVHRRSEMLSKMKNGVSGERKVKSSTLTTAATTTATASSSSPFSDQRKPTKSNLEYDINLSRSQERLISTIPLTTVTTTSSSIAPSRQKPQPQEQQHPSTTVHDRKIKTTAETHQLKQALLPDEREENGESEMPYPVSVSSVKPVPKLEATPTTKSVHKRQTQEQLQHPIPPPYWYYQQSEQKPQQYHHHHPACASLAGKHATSKPSSNQTQPIIYGSEFLATNYPHIFTKVLKPSGSGKSEPRVTSTKKKVTSKSAVLPTDQSKSTVSRDSVDDKKEGKEKLTKQSKKSREKSQIDDKKTTKIDTNETFEQLREDLRSAGFSVSASRPYTGITKSGDKRTTDIHIKESKKAMDKSKQSDMISGQVKSVYTGVAASTSTPASVAMPSSATGTASSHKPAKSTPMEESKAISSSAGMDITSLIPALDSISGVSPRTPIYLDSESEEEPITDTKGMKTVEKSCKVEAKASKKQVEEWIEKSQTAYAKETAPEDAKDEDGNPVEIQNDVDLHSRQKIDMTSLLAKEHSQTSLSQRSLRSHSPSLPLSCHSIEPGSTDISLSSEMSTSSSSYSMLSDYDYTPSGGCSCERVHKHGYDDYSLSSYSSSSCEYPHYTHRSHHSRPSSFRKYHDSYRHQPCYCHTCTSRSRHGHYKRHASEHQNHRRVSHKHPERHHSHHSDHHRYHSRSRHSSGKHSSGYHPHHHHYRQSHHHHHQDKSEKSYKDYHSDEFSDHKGASISSSSKSLEKISLDETVLLKSNLDYSSSMLSGEKLSDVKNSQRELLSSLKSQERILKQELAKQRALTEKLEKIKRYNEKLMNMEKVSLSNPILSALKSGEYHPDDEGGDSKTKIVDDSDKIQPTVSSSESKKKQSLLNERKEKDDKKTVHHRQRHGTLSRSSSHKKTRSRSGQSSSTSRRRLKKKMHERTTSSDHPIKSDEMQEQDKTKEASESTAVGQDSQTFESTEASSSHKKKDKRDTFDSEPQRHHSKQGTRHRHHHEHHRRRHSGRRDAEETKAIDQTSCKQVDEEQKSNQSDVEKSGLPSEEDNLLIIANKGALAYQDGEEASLHEQIATDTSTSITKSEPQIPSSTCESFSYTPDINKVKCDLEVINEKQDEGQPSTSEEIPKEDQHLSSDRKKQSPSYYENVDITATTVKQTEENGSAEPVTEQSVEVPPVAPTCPPPIPYIIPPISDQNDEPGEIMIQQAIDLIDEAVAETTHDNSDNSRSRLLSSINQCLEYGSSEQVVVDDDSEYNGTRVLDILEDNVNIPSTIKSDDDTKTPEKSRENAEETNEVTEIERPCSPCESTTSASEGSEDIEPFPPPPPAEVLAEVIEEEVGPNTEIVEEEEENDEEEEDEEEDRQKSSSVSTVIEVMHPELSSSSAVPLTTTTADNENVTDDKTDVQEGQVEKHASSSSDEDVTIAESFEKEEKLATAAETSVETTTQSTDCEKETPTELTVDTKTSENDSLSS
ncbi:unnamed protein product [Trichobilharzia szidati]|nr:unnamed protein product [Trichobilharzia szidati]